MRKVERRRIASVFWGGGLGGGGGGGGCGGGPDWHVKSEPNK